MSNNFLPQSEVERLLNGDSEEDYVHRMLGDFNDSNINVGMTNKELNEAIETAARCLGNAAIAEDCKYLMFNQLKQLLEIQIKRAEMVK